MKHFSIVSQGDEKGLHVECNNHQFNRIVEFETSP